MHFSIPSGKPAFGGRDFAVQQAQQGGFAAAISTDQAGSPARVELQVEMFEDCRVGGVVVESDCFQRKSRHVGLEVSPPKAASVSAGKARPVASMAQPPSNCSSRRMS